MNSNDPGSAEKKPLTLSAYAKYRGCSTAAVSKAIKKGRLKLSVSFTASGQPQIADAQIADREWTQNTDLSRAPGDVKERADRAAAPPTAAVQPPPAPASEPSRTLPSQQTLKEEIDRDAEGKPLPPPLDPEARWKLSDASAEEKKYKALLAELEYRQRLGELVLAKDVEAGQASLFTIIRTKLLAVPGKARTGAPHLTLADIELIERLIRETLEELATMEPPQPDVTETLTTAEHDHGAAA